MNLVKGVVVWWKKENLKSLHFNSINPLSIYLTSKIFFNLLKFYASLQIWKSFTSLVCFLLIFIDELPIADDIVGQACLKYLMFRRSLCRISILYTYKIVEKITNLLTCWQLVVQLQVCFSHYFTVNIFSWRSFFKSTG